MTGDQKAARRLIAAQHREARRRALVAGEKVFIGAACSRCGSTERYAGSNACRACVYNRAVKRRSGLGAMASVLNSFPSPATRRAIARAQKELGPGASVKDATRHLMLKIERELAKMAEVGEGDTL